MTLFSAIQNDPEDEDAASESDLIWHCLPAEGLWSGELVWLHEPRDAKVNHLLKQIRNGKYKKPYAIDSIRTRRLHFSLRYVQSEMLLDFPNALVFSYTRQMAGFLLFCPRPQKIVVVGLGGGSLTKFCHRHLPMARITTIEIDREVIAFGELFHPAHAANAALRCAANDKTEVIHHARIQARETRTETWLRQRHLECAGRPHRHSEQPQSRARLQAREA